jgi:hypothetical protein
LRRLSGNVTTLLGSEFQPAGAPSQLAQVDRVRIFAFLLRHLVDYKLSLRHEENQQSI